MAELNEEEIERYSRQLLLPGWGAREQLALGEAHVAVSARAEAAALYLAGAGIGRLSLLFAEDDDLATRLRALNSHVQVTHWRKDNPPPTAAILLTGEKPPPPTAQLAIERSTPELSAQALAAAQILKSLSRFTA